MDPWTDFSISGMGKSTNVKSVALVVTRLLLLSASTHANPVAAFRFATSPLHPGTEQVCCNTATTFCTGVGRIHIAAGGQIFHRLLS